MLDGIPFADLTAPTILGIMVMFILLGRIVPRQSLLDKMKEAELWRQAYEAERLARATSDAQTKELLEVAKTTNRIVEAAFGGVDRHYRQSGEAHVVSPTS